jgi:hypothetical protein
MKEGVLALDDTLLPKTGRNMPGAGRFWDANSRSYVHAQCLVTSHYADLEEDYPVSFRQYFKHGSRGAYKGFGSKVDLAMEWILWTIARAWASPLRTMSSTLGISPGGLPGT